MDIIYLHFFALRFSQFFSARNVKVRMKTAKSGHPGIHQFVQVFLSLYNMVEKPSKPDGQIEAASLLMRPRLLFLY